MKPLCEPLCRSKFLNDKFFLIFISYDIWSNYDLNPIQRRSALAYTMKIPSICGPSRYSILEFNGFNEIVNSAHELGHAYAFK